jgi:hypothetical protein
LTVDTVQLDIKGEIGIWERLASQHSAWSCK